MIIVEKPIASIIAEIEMLGKADGPFSELYARGAIDALKWILEGTPPASSGGVTVFPVTFTTEHVH